MPTRINSGAILGLEAVPIEAETDITPGLPTVIVVGLPDTAVQEAKERVKSSIKNSGYSFPKGRVAVNLAPADLPKSGSLYDLPIAISILVESELLNVVPELLQNTAFLGELALDGRIRPVNGTLPIALAALKAGFKNIFVPLENVNEAALVSGLNVWGASTLAQVLAHLEGRVEIKPATKVEPAGEVVSKQEDLLDFSDISGQMPAKRALTIAAAGNHNVLFSGPPGSGKTMLARAFRGILPNLTESEVLEVTKIYSIAGLLFDKDIFVRTRPFRTPHHTSSRIALVGGGSTPKPGEVTLAHRGVLFLDEFPEFPRSTLEALRQPLEDGLVTVSRAAGTFQFPAEFILIAAQNPCPCGNFGNPQTFCQCSDGQIRKYRTRISGPILDRIDLVVDVPAQSYEQLKNQSGPKSADIKANVEQSRIRQFERLSPGVAVAAERRSLRGDGTGKTNSRLLPAEIKEFCKLDPASEQLLGKAIDKLHLSARAYHRLLKVARTIADLENETNISSKHLSEAIQYRFRTE